MHIPGSFREERIEQLHALMTTHPLGLLISYGASGLQASPVPFTLYPHEGELGVMRAHLARANPHWKVLADCDDCLVMFQGEDGYVTPSWYPSKADNQRTVPTWNYVAVEARGKPAIVEDPTWLRRQLDDLTAQHEGVRPQPWSVADAPEAYIASQLKAIIGIEIPIEDIQGKWKLSQNKSERDFQGVINGMTDRHDPHGNPELAARMKST